MDLNEISVYVRVIQAGGFAKAARLLEMPNSTVSAKVLALEKRLGVTLLHRTTRRLNITPEGQAYFERCLRVLEQLRDAERELTLGQASPSGTLRVTAPTILGARLLPEVIASFRGLYPEVRLELTLTDKMVDLIADGYDLALRAGELADSSYLERKLGLTYFATYASREYLKEHGSPKHPRDLAHHECLAFSPLGKESWELVSSGRKVKTEVKANVVADDLNFIKELAVAGGGIALLPSFLCAEESKTKTLYRVLPEWRSDVRPLRFIYPPQRFVTPKLHAFLDHAAKLLRARLEDHTNRGSSS